MNEIKVGGEVDAWCTSCKLMKWHVIVAVVDGKPAKVECNGCHKQHGYKAQPPGTPKPKSSSASVRARSAAALPPPAPAVQDLENKLTAGEALAKTYSPKQTYAVDEFVRHPQFGVGLVVGLPAAQKMEVAFRDGRKLLVHQRGEGAPPAPQLQRPVRHDEDEPRYATDAPPPDKPVG